jgi:hypothetical protein
LRINSRTSDFHPNQFFEKLRGVKKQMIPPRVIQTGKDHELTLKERGLVSSVKLLNPDLEYLYFDDERVETFIDSKYPEYRSIFDAFNYKIQKIDFFRYLAIHHYGGFYFDLDVLLASGLEPLLSKDCVFPFECLTLSSHLREKHGMDWQIGNYAFGAAPGHPFLTAVIENCIRAQREPDWVTPMMRGIPALLRAELYVLNTTGPGLVSRTFAEHPELADRVTVLMPDDVCEPANWFHFGDYGVHLMDGSWRLQRGAFKKRVANYLEGRMTRSMRKKSVLLGPTRQIKNQVRGQLVRA